MDTFELVINSPNITYRPDYIDAKYTYQRNKVQISGSRITVQPVANEIFIRTTRHVPKVGVMLVGWGGNNGSTLTAAILSNKYGIRWMSRNGEHTPNWYGSITQCSTVNLGFDEKNNPTSVQLSKLLPMVDPNDLVIDGWDISSMNLADAMGRARVIEYDLQLKLRTHMQNMVPRPSVYFPEFIAANQSERADNVLAGTMWDQLQQIQADIREFKAIHSLDKVIVMWTANTEKIAEVICGVNDSADSLLAAIKSESRNVSPSTIFAVASILEGCPFINGSPQNTFVPGCVELAERNSVFIGGNDFKSGQTKLKSVLVDFLISAGIKPLSIVSYNHLGNNDGRNLSSPQQFKSKEVSKSSVVDDIIRSNNVLFKNGESPDHCIVIKYIPSVGDSKRALDEYTSEIMMGGRNTLVIHNTCEDSLLAAAIMLDLVLITEIADRIAFKDGHGEYTKMHPVLSLLSYLCKAPLVPRGTPIVNSLFRQRACIENFFRACLSLPPENDMLLEFKINTDDFTMNGN